MKFVWFLIAALVLVAADDDDDDDDSSSNSIRDNVFKKSKSSSENQIKPSALDNEVEADEDDGDETNNDNYNSHDTRGNTYSSTGSTSNVQGRTRTATTKQNNRGARFFGGPGGLGSGFGVNSAFGRPSSALGGFPSASSFGVNSAFGRPSSALGGFPSASGFGVNSAFGRPSSVLGGFPSAVGGIVSGHGSGFGTSGHGTGYGSVAPPSTCRYWCRTPQRQAYCCEKNNQPQSLVGVVKHGQCPPVRPVCPPVRSFAPPATCSNDGACGGIDKCCFDTCLQEHICKAPLGIGR